MFCGTKGRCEITAKALAAALGAVPELSEPLAGAAPPSTPEGEAATPLGLTPTRAGFAEQLRQLADQGEAKAGALAALVEKGFGFHHAGAPPATVVPCPAASLACVLR